MYTAHVHITLKTSVNDPVGLTIKDSLIDLGFETVQTVRSGKYIEVLINENSVESATTEIRKMCDQLLANPIIEDYRFDLEDTQ